MDHVCTGPSIKEEDQPETERQEEAHMSKRISENSTLDWEASEEILQNPSFFLGGGTDILGHTMGVQFNQLI